MHKVVNINIGGRIFHLEENAFEALSNYIDSLKKYFADKPEGVEIVADIENRIAELLENKIKDKSNVTVEDVNEIIGSMGSPKDIAGEEEGAGPASGTTDKASNQQEFTTGKNKIYRDPDGKVVGGVCSGLAYYFDIDSTIVRLIFIALFFAGGSSIFIYLILLFVIPEARTTAEKLAMRKEKINVDTIRKSVEDEFGKIKGSFDKGKYQVKVSGFFQKIFHVIGLVAMAFFRFVAIFTGVVFAIAAVSLFIGLVSLILGTTVLNGEQIGLFNSSYLSFFDNPNDRLLAQIAIVLGLFSAILLFFNISRSLLMHDKPMANKKYFNRIIGTISVVSIILIIMSAVKSASYFNTRSSVETKVLLDSDIKNYILRSDLSNRQNRNGFFENDSFNINDIDLKVETTYGPPELVTLIESRGQNMNRARQNATNCSFDLVIKDSVIVFPETFVLKNDQAYRKQKITFILRLPSGYKFRVENSVDIDLEGHTSQHERLHRGYRYVVLPEGISCENCDRYTSSFDSEGRDYRYSYPIRQVSRVIVSSSLRIRIVKGNVTSLKARGLDASDDLIVDDGGGRLEIKLRSHFFDHFNKNVEVLLVVEDVNNITLEGDVRAELEGFTLGELELNCSGVAKCEGNVSLDYLKVGLEGAPELTLSGNACNLSVKAEGVGKLNAEDLKSDDVIATASGASKINVFARRTLKATASGVGHIRYYGNPASAVCNATGAAKIHKMD